MNVGILATLGAANENAITMVGPEYFRGKLLIDTTNPLDFTFRRISFARLSS